MSLLYFDASIQEFEKKKDFVAAINYLEKMFYEKKEVKILISLVAYSWYYFIEGGFLKKNISGDELDFLSNSWEKFLILGKEIMADDLEFCLIAGFITKLHGFCIDIFNYEEQGLLMLQNSVQKSKDPNIIVLANYFISHEKSKNFDEISKSMFPSESLVDEYFKSILTTII